MGIIVAAKHAAKVDELTGEPADHRATNGNEVQLVWYEVDAGGGGIWEALVEAKIPFTGWHGEGSSYGAMLYAYPGDTPDEFGELQEIAAIGGGDLSPAVECDWKTGQPDRELLKHARAWARANNKVMEMMK